MLPVPRKQNRPTGWENVAAVPPALARVIRDALVPWLQMTADTVQHGAVKEGPTAFPAHMVRTFLAQAKANAQSAAVLLSHLACSRRHLACSSISRPQHSGVIHGQTPDCLKIVDKKRVFQTVFFK